MDTSQLSGFWDGYYRYDLAGKKPVSFDAELLVVDGHVSGLITEPNTFVPGGPPLLGADVDGWADGRLVNFSKTYHPAAGGHTVRYEGTVEEEGTLIAGTWRVDHLSGPFEMRRDPGALEVAEKRRTQTALVPAGPVRDPGSEGGEPGE